MKRFTLRPLAALVLTACQDSTEPEGGIRHIMKRRMILLLLAALAAPIALGCGPTEPGGAEAVDVVRIAAALDSVVANFYAENRAISAVRQHYFLISRALQPSFFPVHARGGLEDVSEIGRGVRSLLLEIRDGRASWIAVLANIPEELLGRTLVYDPDGNSFKIDSTRTGAPPDGVRFILYKFDPGTFLRPSLPLTEIGHLDIVDASTASTINVSMTADVQGATLLSYAVTGALTETRASLAAAGFVSDGVRRVNWGSDYDATLDPATATATDATATSHMSAGTLSLQATISLHVTVESGEIQQIDASLTVGITDGQDTIDLDMDLELEGLFGEERLSGRARFSGQTVAAISGTLEAPRATNAEGAELTLAELAAVENLIRATNDFLDIAVDLLFTPGDLIGIR